jgi:thiamine pyrophosphate-dependent acetolactate synthase large subunit-like protein
MGGREVARYRCQRQPQAMMDPRRPWANPNAINGLINASRQNLPILFTAGRTPITESGALPAARNNYIHWAQEHFDQGGMLREFMKWDYELRHAEQVETVVDRALAIAQSEPQGPVYVTLPRKCSLRRFRKKSRSRRPWCRPAPRPPTRLRSRPLRSFSAARSIRCSLPPTAVARSSRRGPSSTSRTPSRCR